MILKIELTEKELRQLVTEHLQRQLGDIEIKPGFVTIQVKSKQNYKSEWEVAAFRAVYEHTT